MKGPGVKEVYISFSDLTVKDTKVGQDSRPRHKMIFTVLFRQGT